MIFDKFCYYYLLMSKLEGAKGTCFALQRNSV